MSQIIEDAKAEYTRAQNRLELAIKATPEDKLLWAPSPSARTPLGLVAHAAISTSGIAGMLQGKPFMFASMAEMDAALRKMELEFTTTEAVLELLDKNSKEYFDWLDTLTDEQVASIVQLPFGPIPMAAAITFPADHIRGHLAQLEYVQTMYGDYEWRM